MSYQRELFNPQRKDCLGKRQSGRWACSGAQAKEQVPCLQKVSQDSKNYRSRSLEKHSGSSETHVLGPMQDLCPRGFHPLILTATGTRLPNKSQGLAQRNSSTQEFLLLPQPSSSQLTVKFGTAWRQPPNPVANPHQQDPLIPCPHSSGMRP